MEFFISGTDTGIGKSVLSALLCRYYVEQGRDTAYFKPVQTGAIVNETSLSSSDVNFVQSFSRAKSYSSLLFKRPASPHYAAELENRAIDLNQLLDDYKAIQRRHEAVISEGAGGLFVPLDRKGLTMAHLCREMKTPLILAGRAGLGTINHTGLSVYYARSLGIPVQSIFLFSSSPAPSDLEEDNISILKNLLDIPRIHILPVVDDVDVDNNKAGQMEKLYSHFKALLKERDFQF